MTDKTTLPIADLLAHAEQVNPPMTDEEREPTPASLRESGGRLEAMPVLLDAGGVLYEGINRLELARDEHGRSDIDPDEYIVTPTVTTREERVLAAIRAQNARRATTGFVRAYQARFLMSTFGYGVGVAADKLGIRHRPQLSRWLSDNPTAGAEFDIPDERVGKDGRVTWTGHTKPLEPRPEPVGVTTATPATTPAPGVVVGAAVRAGGRRPAMRRVRPVRHRFVPQHRQDHRTASLAPGTDRFRDRLPGHSVTG